MKIKNLYKPFEVESRIVDSYIASEHRNTYFEMVFVLSGSGTQIINDHKLGYGCDKLFLIFPQDSHGFEIKETTHFFFLRFNESYLKNQANEWLKKLEYIFHNHDHMPGCILKNITDKPLIRALAEAVLREQNEETPYSNEVLQQLINTFITIAARNIGLKDSVKPLSYSHTLSLQGYIHNNIYEPELLKIGTFAAYFNISPTYLSELFKKQTGETLQNYISEYRIKLIESRLKNTNARLNEIAAEFGLADSSHLNKIFYRHKGMSPSAYRKSV